MRIRLMARSDSLRPELLAQLGDVHVHGSRLDALGFGEPPDLAQQAPPGEDAARLAGKEREERGFPPRQLDATGAAVRPERARLHPPVAEAERLLVDLFRQRAGTAQQGVHPRHQLCH
jgi:hypothetical protein